MFAPVCRFTVAFVMAVTRAACAGAQPESSQPRVTATPQPTRAATPVLTSAVPAIESRYTDLQQAQTPEGYHMLGQPDAPITLTHYSDFI